MPAGVAKCGKSDARGVGQQPIAAEMDQQHGLPHDPLKPAQLLGLSGAGNATARFRGHVVMDG